MIGKRKKIIYGLQDVSVVAKQLSVYVKDYSVVTFTGPLGAGKTTLIQSILRQNGVADVITSPTFTYVNLYTGADEHTFYHFDLYRLSTEDDFIAAGFDEYLYQPDSTALIEWPAVIKDLLDHSVWHITLSYYEKDETKRVLTVSCKD